MLKTAALGLALLLTAPALAESEGGTTVTRAGRAYFGFGAGGGSIVSRTLLDSKAERAGAIGFAAGVGELSCGFHINERLSLGLVGQSLEFAPYAKDETSAKPSWSGGAGGLLLKAESHRVFVRTGILLGSVEESRHAGRSPTERGVEKTTREAFVGGRAELGVTLVRTAQLDVTLAGGVQPMLLDHSPGAGLDRRLYLSRASLELSFHPDGSGSAAPYGHYAWQCHGCGDGLYYAGRGLVELGSFIGRATANGIFRVLVR